MPIHPQTKFGSFWLGQQPLVVGTVSQPATLAGFRAPSPPACHIVEVRLDLIGADTAGWLDHARAIEAQGLPVILTIRLAIEGGGWTQPDEARWPLFEQGLQHLTAADIEYRSALRDRVSALARQQQRSLIISFHDFTRTPPLEELQQIVRTAANSGTVVKIATLTQTEADLMTLRALCAEQCTAALCLLGMGPLGPQTRLELPRAGSCFAYGYLDQPVAPGQPAAAELMQQLNLI